MLRTKQLSTLTHSARSILLGGSRNGNSDGASCTCPEDDKRVPRKQSNRFGFQPKQKNSVVARESASKAVSPSFNNHVGSVNHRKHESSSGAASAPSPLSPTPTLQSDSTALNGNHSPVNNDGHSSQKGSEYPSNTTANHIAKASSTTAGMFSELIKIPRTDGRGIDEKQNCMVSSSQPSPNINSSKGKSRNRTRRSKLQPNPSNITGGSDSFPKDGSVKTKQCIPATYGVVHKSSTNTQGQRQCVPRSVNFHSESAIYDTNSGGTFSESEVAASIPQNIRSANKLQHPMRSMRSMRSQTRGAQFNQRSMNNVRAVELYHHTLQQLQRGSAAEEVLDNLGCKLDPFQANQVLKLQRDHSVAFRFFQWLKHQPGFKHDEHTYTTMIGILGQAKQFGVMKRLLEEMINDGCEPTVVTFNRLIHAYGRANYIGDAVEAFHQMQEAGYEPDRVTYCTLIDIHAKAGYLEIALDLYQRMQEVGLSPDTFTYSAMVNCLGKGGHLAAANKLFSEMIEQGCVPNLVTYNIMIALQAKARNYPSAVKLYRDMQAAGFHPDKVTYNIVMEVLGHCGHLDEVEVVFMEMKQDWIPDEPVYGLLVDLWGKAGNVDKAQSWYQSMLEAGVRPNVPTCNSLLSAFLKAHRFSDAHCVLENMHGLGLSPSLQTYTLLLSCCTETHVQMGLCCRLMAVTGHPAHAFLVSLPDAEPGGQNVRDHARSFLDLMHSEDRESKRGLIDAMINFLHKSGLKEEAGWVWEVAAQRNVYPDSVREKQSSYWLINLHVMSEGTAVTALSRTLAWFQRQLLASGDSPHRIDIITGWGRRSRVTGSSLVRHSVQELLQVFKFPFFSKRGNNGCFVGCGEPLNRWLLNSYVERMHLL